MGTKEKKCGVYPAFSEKVSKTPAVGISDDGSTSELECAVQQRLCA